MYHLCNTLPIAEPGLPAGTRSVAHALQPGPTSKPAPALVTEGLDEKAVKMPAASLLPPAAARRPRCRPRSPPTFPSAPPPARPPFRSSLPPAVAAA